MCEDMCDDLNRDMSRQGYKIIKTQPKVVSPKAD